MRDVDNYTELLSTIRSLRFEGATGQVKFDANGDRAAETVRFKWVNVLAAADGSIRTQDVLNITHAGASMAGYPAIHWPGNRTDTPWDQTVERRASSSNAVELHFIPVIAGVVVCGVGLSLLLFYCCWRQHLRHVRTLRIQLALMRRQAAEMEHAFVELVEEKAPSSSSPNSPSRSQGRKPSFYRATTFSILHQSSAERVVAAPWKLLRTLTSLIHPTPAIIDTRLGQGCSSAHSSPAGSPTRTSIRTKQTKRSIVDELPSRGILPIPEMPEMPISQREISQRGAEEEASCRAVSISQRGSSQRGAEEVEQVASCRLSGASRQTVTVTDDSAPSTAPSGGPQPGDPIRAVLAKLGEGRLSAQAFCTELRASAARLRDPKYTLLQFHDDMHRCFPELQLYLAETAVADAPFPVRSGSASSIRIQKRVTQTTSGYSGEDEFKRTMGALFAVYWLARLDLPEVHGSSGMDGQRGFCFGVDQKWAPPTDAEVQAIARKLSGQLVPETLAQKQVRKRDRRQTHLFINLAYVSPVHLSLFLSISVTASIYLRRPF